MRWLKLALLAALVFVLASCTFFPKGVVVPPIDPGPSDPIDDPKDPNDPGTSEEWDIQSWAHKIAYMTSGLNDLSSANADLIVMDISENRNLDYHSANAIEALKNSGSGKKVLAWVPAGRYDATNRPRYTDSHSDLLSGTGLIIGSGTTPQVKFWDGGWIDFLMEAFIDQAIAAGFDGIILEHVDKYGDTLYVDEFDDDESSASAMAQFMIDLSDHVKAKKADFKVFHYNATGFLYNTFNDASSGVNNDYVDAIDGVIVWRNSCTDEACETELENLQQLEALDKVALVAIHSSDEEAREAACELFADYGFVGYSTHDNNAIGTMCDAI